MAPERVLLSLLSSQKYSLSQNILTWLPRLKIERQSIFPGYTPELRSWVGLPRDCETRIQVQDLNLGGDRRKLQECSGEGKEAQREHVVEQMAIVGNRDSLLLGASGAGAAVERTSEWPHAQVGAPCILLRTDLRTTPLRIRPAPCVGLEARAGSGRAQVLTAANCQQVQGRNSVKGIRAGHQ